jgi:hypothetical protein
MDHQSKSRGGQSARSVKHVGFEAAAKNAAKGEHVGMERGRAIIAAAAHKASKGAIKKNPRLKRVPGVGGK